jgi:tetratricopeptide (TPR) repeat protein
VSIATGHQIRPATLFKYRADGEFTERIFTSGLVWLSTATQLNDPFECSFRSAPAEWVSRTILQMKNGQFQGLFMQLSAAVHEGIPFFGLPRQQLVAFFEELRGQEFEDAYQRLRRFAENASGRSFSDPDRLLDDLEDRRNSLGIFSMADAADNMLMWTHYGGEHQGLCIGFKIAEGAALADPDRCFPIRYAAGLPGFGDGGLITDLQVFAAGQTEVGISLSDPTFHAAISTKSPDWAYEREWRYVERRGGSYEWPAPISEVTFGLRSKPVRRAHYLDLIEEFVAGDVAIYDIEKIPDGSALKRKLSHVIRGKGKAETLRNEGNVERLGTAATFGADIERLVRARRYDAALDDLDRHLAKDPHSAQALAQKATALGLSGRHEEALQIYESLCDRFPDIGDGWYQRGVALTELNRFPEALDCYRRALALQPVDASTNFNLGCLLAHIGKADEALAHLRIAVREGHPRAAAVIAEIDHSAIE